MSRRLLILLLTALALLPPVGWVAAQEYVPTPVTVSKDKVRGHDGKVYLSHVVLERQTLFSIAKAYGVTVDAVCAANPDKHLREEGLKTNDILLIPTDGAAPAAEEVPQQDGEYVVHVVRWYENITDIARKYNVPVDAIIRYNGLDGKKLKARQELKIPLGVPAGGVADAPVAEPADTVAAAPARDTVPSPRPLDDLLSIFKRKQEVKALLALPFGTGSGKANDNIMDFYAGFLLGVRDLGEEGISTDLSVVDIATESATLTPDVLRQQDIIIGPVGVKDLRKMIGLDEGKTPLVSPLDPQALALASEKDFVIHAPAPHAMQYEELVRWIREDYRPGDKVIVIGEKNSTFSGITELAQELLKEQGVPFELYNYSILESRHVPNTLLGMVGPGVNRILLTSESEAFVNDLVRNLGLVMYRKNEVVLYSSSRVRSFGTLEVENLHKLSTHAACSFYIDYDDPSVHRFLMAYRALYKTEPTQFSYQGYDIAAFFLRAPYQWGNRWLKTLTTLETVRLLQSDFRFAEEAAALVEDETIVENGAGAEDADPTLETGQPQAAGLVNQGVRRVIYQPDNTVRYLR